MASMGHPPGEDPLRILTPLNPLQTSHSHMYPPSQKQRRLRRKEVIGQEKRESTETRASKQVAPDPDTDGNQLKRKTSRLGLFAFFSRNKSSQETPIENRLETQEKEEGRLGNEHQEEIQPESLTISTLAPDADARPVQVQNVPIQHQPSKRALKTKESFTTELNIKKRLTWEPPPLFQAYPQSVKHATLQTPALAAETIVRLSHDRQGAKAKHTDADIAPSDPKKQKEKKQKKASALEIVSKRDWTEKVYVLVTEGYLLQYAGRGSHDRQAEKIMPLSKYTAAFASDAISGQHYVLQISQVTDKDGTINPEISRSMLKKAGLRNEMKRSASTFLLVLNDPEEMNAWLVAVRKEIAAFSGKEYEPEVFGTDGMQGEGAVGAVQQIQRIPSQRYLVKREPHRFSQKPCEPPPEVTFSSHMDPEETPDAAPQAAAAPSPPNRYSMATQDSTNSCYISDTTASIDQVRLDRLRESPRESYSSTCPKTASTSRCSSAEHSPVVERFDAILEVKVPSSRQGSPNLGLQRASTLQKPTDIYNLDVEQHMLTPSNHPTSTATTPTTSRVASVTTPNFSVPTFSKRFSMNSWSLATSIQGQTLPISGHDDNFFELKAKPQRSRDPLAGGMSFRPATSSRAENRMSWLVPSGAPVSTAPKPCSLKALASGEAQSPRRQSSLGYAKGVSSVWLPNLPPPPHPPPTTALPQVPDPLHPKHVSLIPPPARALPSVPGTGHHGACFLPSRAVSNNPLPSAVLIPPPPNCTRPFEMIDAHELRRSISLHVRPKPPSPNGEQR
ncbi:MAG: hypothetical protein Q9163_001014 [Psora crenata]